MVYDNVTAFNKRLNADIPRQELQFFVVHFICFTFNRLFYYN